MNIGSEKYKQYADAHAPKSRVVRNSLMAFLFGGLICAVAEALTRLYVTFGMARDDAGLLTSVTLIFVAAVLTAAGVFDNIAKVAGAGTLLPIEKAAAIVRNYTAQAEEKSATETKYEATLPLLLEDEEDAE